MTHSTESPEKAEHPTMVPRACTLDGFAALASASSSRGVSLADLDPITTLAVRTMNSLYRIIVLQPPTRVVVQGGEFFPDPTEASLSGSSLGGSCLKMAWIGRGFCMEIEGPMGRIVTSPVRSIHTPDTIGASLRQ